VYFVETLQGKGMTDSISQDEMCAVSDIANNIFEGRLVVKYVHRHQLKQH
jgi:hypothetical protein